MGPRNEEQPRENQVVTQWIEEWSYGVSLNQLVINARLLEYLKPSWMQSRILRPLQLGRRSFVTFAENPRLSHHRAQTHRSGNDCTSRDLDISAFLISMLAAKVLSIFVPFALNPNAANHENHLDQPTPA